MTAGEVDTVRVWFYWWNGLVLHKTHPFHSYYCKETYIHVEFDNIIQHSLAIHSQEY